MAMGPTVGGNSLTTSAVTAGSVEYHTAVVIPTMLLDSVDIKAIRLLKVDVEGYEMRIFRAWPWERVRPQHILCEFHEPSIEAAGESVAEMLKFFRELGYVARNVDGELHRDGEKILEERTCSCRSSKTTRPFAHGRATALDRVFRERLCESDLSASYREARMTSPCRHPNGSVAPLRSMGSACG
jgi:hypothetical protein